MLIHIRLTPDMESDLKLLKQIINTYSMHTQPMLLVVHEQDNVKLHYHTVFSINVKKIDTVRTAVKKIWTGNSKYQLKKCDEQMFQYIMHPGSKVICKQMFTENDIDNLKNKSKEYHDMLVNLKKKKCKKQISVREELNKFFHGKKNLNQYEISKKMIELCIEHDHIFPSIYYGKQLVLDIYGKSNFRDSESEIVNMYVTDMTRI